MNDRTGDRPSSTSPASAPTTRPRRPRRAAGGQNSPQKVPFGLYAEQLSGSSFTTPRAAEPALVALPPAALRDAPAVQPHRRRARAHRALPRGRVLAQPPALGAAAGAGRRPTDFVDGLATLATGGDARAQHGCGRARLRRQPLDGGAPFLFDADGELLIVPQEGALTLRDRDGAPRRSRPARSRVIPRGIRFRVEIDSERRARLRVRELRRAAAPARAGPDRLQRPRQPARFPRARRRLRGPRRAHASHRQVRRPPVERPARPFAARRRRVARQLLSVQVRPRALQHHEHA